MRSYPPEAKQDDRRSTDADDGNTDGVAAIADLKRWRMDKQSLCTASGDNRKYANQQIGHKQARSGDFKGLYRLFSNFFQN
jgi:hypothetical protein